MKHLVLLIAVLLLSGGITAQNCQTSGDTDGDGLCNDIDPCPDVANPNPVDDDGDEVYNACDNCLSVANADQIDIDGDGIGDACDPCVDPDGDGVCGSQDQCPNGDDNIDVDFDGIPDDCDNCIDVDRDDICDDEDECLSTNSGSSCNDGNPCTTNDRLDEFCNCNGTPLDEDGDGVCDLNDQCPGFDDRADFDGDGIPDACDDSPNCTTCIPDESGKFKICHIFSDERASTYYGDCSFLDAYFDKEGAFVNAEDHCGPCTCADENDLDTDGDGICDKKDPCPFDANDTDGDGVCDSQDICSGSDDNVDTDRDGVPDGCDDKQYCIPSYNTIWEWISFISLDGKSYSNGQSSPLELNNTIGQPLEKGMPHVLLITPEYIDEIRELSTHIYVDLNDDGDFVDNGELLHETRSLDPTQLELDIDDWDAGTYRMRVILHYGRIKGPCQEDVEGEIEDLLIEIIDAQPCAQVSESFDYDLETLFEEVSGGIGWSGSWTINKEVTSSQVSLLNGSLASGSGNKIGILNTAGTAVQLNRAIDADLSGSSSLSFSIILERAYGSGSVDMQLGDLDFGISSDERFYLEDQKFGELFLNKETEIFLQINLNQEGLDEILMTINPDESDNSSAAFIMELGSKVGSLDIVINSEDSFVPSVHYIDEIHMGCDDNFEKKQSSSKRSLLKQSFQKPQLEIIENDLSIWPNPVVRGNTNVFLQGQNAIYEYVVSGTNGLVVSQGLLLPGLNRLPIQELESGVYYLTVKTEKGLLTKKLIF